MKASDIMTTNVITVEEDLTISGVCKLLVESDISGVPVVNKEDRLVGMVTERDLLFHNPFITSVKDLMTKEVVTVAEDTPVEEISRLLLDNFIKRVPVVREGNIVGIVSRLDILRGKVEFGEY
jgi:CBS domain-containing protein